MVQILAQHKKFAIAWYLLRMMLHRNLLSPTPFIILIKEYAAANEAGKAIKTFRAMEKLGLAQDSSSWYELLRTLCEHGNAEEAEDLLLANSKLFPLTSQGFNLLLKSAADAATAKRLWREMAARCVPPDETSYALLIESFAMAGNLFEALRLYDDMKRKKGMVPPAEVYRSLIYVMAREGMAGEARKLLGKAAAYDCLARALCEAGKVEEAREVVEGMAEVEKETYWALMGAESLEGSLGLLKRMTEMGCGPDGRVFLVGLEKFFARKEAGNALRVWGEMGRYGVAREEVHFLAVARGLVDCGWMEKGMEVYAAMKRCGFRPDPKLEGIFREHLSGARRWSRGPLRAAPARDWKHDPLRAAPSCVDIEGKSSGRFNVKA
ncbi:tetratricopeptide repeat (TPR)-like superfamily protein [Wolffia australiana]